MLEAREAVGVLFDREVLKLLAVIAVGWSMAATAAAGTGWVRFPGAVHALYAGVLALANVVGYAIYYGGVLALLVKLVHDVTVIAQRR